MRNPGPRYDGTRHNVGGRIVELIADRHRLKFKRARLGIRAQVAEANLGGSRAVVALPTTFMNESGQAVGPLVRYFRCEPDRLLVVHDDIDLPFAKLRVQHGRGPGGQNGVASIIKTLGTNEFWRLKFGVGRPPGSKDPADHVLDAFTKAEREEVELMVQYAADAVEAFITSDAEAARQIAGTAGGRGGT